MEYHTNRTVELESRLLNNWSRRQQTADCVYYWSNFAPNSSLRSKIRQPSILRCQVAVII